MAECSHYLELFDVVMFECERPLGHEKKHRCWTDGQGVGPRPMGGKPRKQVQVLIEWDR